MIPTIGLKVLKEEGKKDQTTMRILRKGDRPEDLSSESESDDYEVVRKKNKNELRCGKEQGNVEDCKQKKKPSRVIQKSSVVNNNETQEGGMSRRAMMKKRLVMQSKIETLSSDNKLDNNIKNEGNEDNNKDELMNFIHDDNEKNNAQFNTIIKEDVIEIKTFSMPTTNYEKITKPPIQYESEREKKLMEKYVLDNSSGEDDDSSSSQENKNINPSSSTSHNQLKPIFISNPSSKPNPNLIQSQLQEEATKALRLKQQDTTKILQSYLEKEAQSKNQSITENYIELPDDTDDPDDIAEYEQWKIRELKRIKRQIEDTEEKLKSKIEIERRRNMTDEERRDENIKLGSDDTLRTFKSKINYLQKYYHKGAYFQDDASGNTKHIYNRDFNLPTWEDKVDRSAFGELFEKRRGNMFKKGQTKYTHLTKEDTTNFDPAFRVPDQIASNLMNKSAGLKSKNDFTRK